LKLRYLFLTALLLAVIVVSLVSLRWIERSKLVDSEPFPLIESTPPPLEGGDDENYADRSAEELFIVADELLGLWHVREATALFEMAAARDSSYYPAYLKLVECYADPLVSREDEARNAMGLAHAYRPVKHGAMADTSYLAGLERMYVACDYAGAAQRFAEVEDLWGGGAETSWQRATALYHAGHLDDARRLAAVMLERDDSVGRVMELAARCAVAVGDYDEAERISEGLVRMYAAEPHPHVVAAQVELMLGDVE